MARELGMTVRQLLENTDAQELGEWIALRRQEGEEQRTNDLIARAEGAARKR